MNNVQCRPRIMEKQINEPVPVNVKYPHIEGLQNKEAESMINSRVEAEVQKLLASQLNPSLSIPDFSLSTFEGSYVVTVNKDCILSIKISDYVYWTGAAHGFTLVESLTFDLRTGKVYALKDLFKPGSPYRVKINNLIKRQIKDQNLTLLSEFNGIDDYHSFYLTATDLVIYYQLYDLVPYALGIPEFRIPLRYLRELVDSDSPVLELIDNRNKM